MPNPTSINEAGSGTKSAEILIEASAKNWFNCGPPPATANPRPPLTVVMFIDNDTVPGTINDCNEPPVTAPSVVVNNAPVPGGPSTPVSALLVSGPCNSRTFAGSYRLNCPPWKFWITKLPNTLAGPTRFNPCKLNDAVVVVLSGMNSKAPVYSISVF